VNTNRPTIGMETPVVYEIRVDGYLEEDWTDWFDGMTITHLENGVTNITGPISDQPALFGLLFKLSGLNLTLLSVNRVSSQS
jgi:hypothetical protein